jgi:hypothetical protein
MNLPKTYQNDASGNYPQHLGKPKISYSQYTSWKNEEYKLDYIFQYFIGGTVEDNIFALYGGEVGEYIEKRSKGEKAQLNMMSQEDANILDSLDYPKNCIYEDEIVVDCGDFVIQGFTDRTELVTKKQIGILDYKTGNTEKKADFYGSDEYGQTTLYCYQKTKEGFKVKYSKVVLLGRKGNGYEKYPLKLSGDILEIDTPYSPERAEKLLLDIRNVANEISDCYDFYLKIFK